MNRYSLVLGSALSTLCLVSAARAGIAECNDIRLEDAADCEFSGTVDCTASCSELGVFKKACATKLHKVCRDECQLDVNPTCTDECTVQCSSDCDRGINVICSHNCFLECVGSCDVSCDASEKPEQCRASCEATCDGECDIKCRPIVDGACYTHCIECCGGSCQAEADMDCQTTCQDETFEECEYEIKADCDASCSADGALFCDGEYVLSGPQMISCAKELVKRGIADLDIDGDIDGDIDIDDKLKTSSGGGCQLSPGGNPASSGSAGALLLASLCWLKRRSRAGRPVR